MGYVCLQNVPSLLFYAPDYPAAQSSKQHSNESRVSNLTDSSPLTDKSAMSHSVDSSPMSKSIDPNSFTDMAVVNASRSIDPSSFTSTSAERQVYDSPPTAADQETWASEIRLKTGEKMKVI